MMALLATYIPFVHPIQSANYWWYVLVVPLAFGIAVVYKAMRVHTFDGFWRETLALTAQIVLAMLALAIALGLLIVFIIPLLPAE